MFPTRDGTRGVPARQDKAVGTSGMRIAAVHDLTRRRRPIEAIVATLKQSPNAVKRTPPAEDPVTWIYTNCSSQSSRHSNCVDRDGPDITGASVSVSALRQVFGCQNRCEL